MARRRFLGLSAAFGLATMLHGCGIFGGVSKYRFRMTVEVETPHGLRTGSSVYQVVAGYRADLQPGGRAREWSARGEAVAVSIPGGKTLFALLKTTNLIRNDLAQISMAALDPAFKNDIPESARRIANGNVIVSPADVAMSDYPVLVTFGDTENPNSVSEVKANDLSSSFGPGVKLKRIVVEVTNDPVTTGIEKRLSWLRAFYGKMLGGKQTEDLSLKLADHLGGADFSTELS